jgi:hypothetical protein
VETYNSFPLLCLSQGPGYIEACIVLPLIFKERRSDWSWSIPFLDVWFKSDGLFPGPVQQEFLLKDTSTVLHRTL